jgi:hypothetical protein
VKYDLHMLKNTFSQKGSVTVPLILFGPVILTLGTVLNSVVPVNTELDDTVKRETVVNRLHVKLDETLSGLKHHDLPQTKP